ncbi:serpin family protein [Qipengyuania aquimaris]|uniref:serpin family protein n=1 Tax=Qipengyuania aquimaris TaxID=255984 RepID=UPI001C97205C|nr:serpin family protein [Qipengyuania aquimaris]MBY6127732.1 serpin family protein [Qipengyuania aquimaris]
MMKPFTNTRSGLAAVLAILAAAGYAPVDRPEGASVSSSEQQRSGALALFPVLDAEAKPEENVVISPASIDLAFGLLHAGARSDTRQQIEDILPPPADPLGFESDERDVRVNISNALFLDRDFRFRDSYLRETKRTYEAEAETVDFTDRQASADRINAWANEATEGLIPEVIAPSGIEDTMVALLANALCFEGLWRTKLTSQQELPFLFGSGDEKPFTFVGETFDTLYTKSSGWEAIRLPYRNPRYAMDIMIPEDREIMSAAPSLEFIERMKLRLDDEDPELVRVQIPQFETDYSQSLVASLQKLGLTLPFNEVEADLSGIAEPGQRPISVSEVKHVTKLQVYDEGTKAAAVTTISIVLSGGRLLPKEPILFRADRPFIVVLRDLERDAVLFIGRIADPQPFEPEVIEP